MLSHFEISAPALSFILDVTCPSRIRLQTFLNGTLYTRKWGRSGKPPQGTQGPSAPCFPHGRQEAYCSGTQRTFSPDRARSALSSIILTFSKNYGKMLATIDRKQQLGWLGVWSDGGQGHKSSLSWAGSTIRGNEEGDVCVCVGGGWAGQSFQSQSSEKQE